MRSTGSSEQSDQVTQLFLRQVAELAFVTGADLLTQLAQQVQTGLGDANADDTTVRRGTVALDQAASLQRVEQARDVGGARHETRGQVERRQSSRPLAAEPLTCSAQQPQRVVLLRCQIVATEQLLLDGAHAVVGPPEVQ